MLRPFNVKWVSIALRLREWAVENEMKINPNKSKAISFTRARVKDPLIYSLRDQNIPEANFCKYLGIIIRSDLNYTVQKAWRAVHFVMRVVKGGNKNTRSLAYTSLVRPILEYGAACWDPYRECQISALDRVQNKAAKFAHFKGGSVWESLAQRSVGWLHGYVHFTKRTTVKGRGRI
jgi:hypothetical protein